MRGEELWLTGREGKEAPGVRKGGGTQRELKKNKTQRGVQS